MSETGYRAVPRLALIALLPLAACQSTPTGTPSIQLPATLPGYTIVTGPPAQLARGSSVTVNASCPAGRVAVGGGLSSGGNFEARLRGSAPLPGGAGWSVRMDAVGVGAAITVTAFAVCATRPADYLIQPLTASIQTQQVLSFDVACPRGTQQISGGGFDVPGGDAVRVFSQQVLTPSADAFRVRARSDLVLPGRSNLGLSAVCADFSALPRRGFVDSPTSQVGPGSTVTLTAACPSGTSATHGGVASIDDQLLTLDSMPTGGGSGWSVVVFNPNLGGGPLSARIRLVCVATSP